MSNIPHAQLRHGHHHPAAELVLGFVADNSVPTLTAGSEFSAVGTVTGSSGSGAKTLTSEFLLASATGTYAATGTLSGGQQWRAAAIADTEG